MAVTIIYTKCSNCGGDGVYSYYGNSQTSPPIIDQPCAVCSGTGKLSFGEIDLTTIDDIFDKVKKIKKTVDDIWDKVNV